MTAPVTDSAVLKLLNVESAYGPIKAIRGVSLQVRRGEIATVLGSNGAGKTTILKTISGIIDPRKGSIEFKGSDITAQDPAHIVQQGLMHVPEGREVFPLLSVRDNLLMGAYTRKDRDGVARDMEVVFSYFPILRERAVQDAGLLSGGQQQMLAISRALMANPRPDPAGRTQPGPLAQADQGDLRDRGAHQPRARHHHPAGRAERQHGAQRLGHYGYVLENGRIVMEDTCARLREKEDIKEFYLGMKEAGVRADRRWKKKKNWR